MSELAKVLLTYNERTVEAEVLIASPNRRSLMLRFEAMIDNCVGMMPTLEDDHGNIINIVTGNTVKIEWIKDI